MCLEVILFKIIWCTAAISPKLYGISMWLQHKVTLMETYIFCIDGLM